MDKQKKGRTIGQKGDLKNSKAKSNYKADYSTDLHFYLSVALLGFIAGVLSRGGL